MEPSVDRLPEIPPISRDEDLRDDPLRDSFVWWDDITEEDVDSYQAALDSADDERPLQRHLAEHPVLLVQFLSGGHGRWVLPHLDLGGRYEADFIVGHRYSGPTWEWFLVELQRPNLETPRNPSGRLFTREGRIGEQLDEGLRQIDEWRRWIAANRDTARRSRDEMGLGLTAIESDPPGLLLIGRENDLTPEHAERRLQISRQKNVQIHSYDWLIREATRRLHSLALMASSGTGDG